MGGYNVLAKPLDMKEVFHVVGLAWLFWKRRWERPHPHATLIASPALLIF